MSSNIRTLLLLAFVSFACVSEAQQVQPPGITAINQTITSQTNPPTNPVSATPDRGYSGKPASPPLPTQQPAYRSAFSSDPGTFRSWFVDGTAAIFGILAVFFAIVTVIVTVVGIITGISKFRDLIERVESDLKKKVDEEFSKRLDEVVQQQVEPKVKTIIEEQLKNTLETGRQRIEEEITKSISDSDLKDTLIREVATEIQKRLTSPQTPKVESKEFGQ